MAKHYRMRKPINVVKGAIAKVQHDHPVISGAATLIAMLGMGGGAIDAAVKGRPVGAAINPIMDKVPGYQLTRTATRQIVGSVLKR